MKNIWKYIGMILSAILPIAALAYFTGIYDFPVYNMLWCGFYGSIIVCILCRSKLYKGILVVFNAAVLLLCSFGALMGGIQGLSIILLYTLIPFYSVIQSPII